MKSPAKKIPQAAGEPRSEPLLESRAARRKRQTEERLLDAGLRVFCERGYDAATTGEIARVADVAAGTFYVHFGDKRAIYERLAGRAARELLDRSATALEPSMSSAERLERALRITRDFWRADLDRARLLLEGGPSLGSAGHMRFVDETAALFADAPDAGTKPGGTPHAVALLGVGLTIEMGRLIVARPEAEQEVEDLIRLACGLYQS